MLELGNSLKLAQQVLNRVLEKQNESVEGWVEAFENCREQGYKIIANIGAEGEHQTRTIALTMYRNTDAIAVYYIDKYESLTWGYSDEFWESLKGFEPDEIDQAAEYILGLMKRQ
jgi:Icc-related predicted phosphoesterase